MLLWQVLSLAGKGPLACGEGKCRIIHHSLLIEKYSFLSSFFGFLTAPLLWTAQRIPPSLHLSA